MAADLKDILQEIAEDKGIKAETRIQACGQLHSIEQQERYERDERARDRLAGIFPGEDDPLEKRLSNLEKDVEEALEVFRHLSERA